MRLLMGLLALAFVVSGCSVVKAINAPGPVPVESVKVGSSRTEMISVFGMPRSTEVIEGQRTDIFEFIDGHPTGSKARIILYLAGDLVTLALAEIIFWPLESAALQGTEGRAIATYGPDNVVSTLTVTEIDGTPWGTKEVEAAPEDDDME